jgi:hypothetical protein
MEALVQTGAPVTVYRDVDKNWTRTPGDTQRGMYGINHHSTGPYPVTLASIGGFSAGCLVAPFMTDHKMWMTWVKSDERYRADHEFVFSVTVIPQEWQV